MAEEEGEPIPSSDNSANDMNEEDEEDMKLFIQAIGMYESGPGREVSDEDSTLQTRLAGPSSHKAGLDSVDKDSVNRIIYETSKGSAFFEYERKKDEATTKSIQEMLTLYEKFKDMDLSFETHVVDGMIREEESKRDLSQCICHIDMDAFYASVEELDEPKLKTIPMAVGSLSMLCTSNYEARKYGVRSGMPGYIALKLCPTLRIVPLHFDKYRSASNKIRDILSKYDPQFLPLSLDEAYLNLTNYLSTVDQTPDQVVQQIRDDIFQATQLTASAGIAANRMLAKVCSDMKKPNGQYLLPSDRETILNFVGVLPIRKISGVGRVTERILDALQVRKCGDFYERRSALYKLMTPKTFKFLIRCYLGLGSTWFMLDTPRKSMSVERTFQAISDESNLLKKMEELSGLLANDLAKAGLKGKTIGVKLKQATFELRVRSKTLPSYIHKAEDIARVATELLKNEFPVNLRLMGVRISSLQSTNDDIGVKKYFIGIDKTSSKDQQQLTFEENIPEIECPVCGKSKKLGNIQFNQHVDECLNQTILNSETNRFDTPASRKRRRGQTKSLPDYWNS